MRIGVNARLLLNHHMEGMSRYIFETTTSMALANPEDDFILFFDRKTKERPTFPINVQCITIPLPTRHPILWYIWFEICIPLYLKRYKIDVFYSGDGYLSLNTKVPTVLVLHDLAYLHYPTYVNLSIYNYYKKYTPLFLLHATNTVTVSMYVKNDILRHFDLDEKKVFVIPNAVRENHTLEVSSIREEIKITSDGAPYFIYVGSLHPRKNIVGMIDAFKQFSKNSDSEYRFILAGRMAWKTDEIKTAITNTPNVNYVGVINESEKIFLIRHALSLVYLSWFEGFGIPILEGMRYGVPVITSDVTSMPEVADGAAILASPNSIQDMSSAMSKIASDPSLRKSLIEKGKQRVSEFQWENSAAEIYLLLKKAAFTTEKD